MRYIEIIRLDENQAQYQQMLAGMVSYDIITADDATAILKNVRTVLKRNDRIVWWLKWYRLTDTYYVIDRILKRSGNEDRAAESKQVFQKITKTNYDTVDRGQVNRFRMSFENKFSMEHIAYQLTIPTIDQLVWDVNTPPVHLSSTLAQLEEEYNSKRSQLVTPKPGDKIILNYGKSAWVMLDRGACSDEAAAMGHCGNAPSERLGDRILSFRTLMPDGRQKPHLTFILHKNGFLGEMKGRANEKPNSKYHKYIVDLLKQDFIKGIVGGGYEPEKNFALWDLPPAQAIEVLTARPELIPKLILDPMISNYKKEKVPPEVQPFLVKADKHWVLYITNLIPELKPLRKELTYAIVTEPGLTALDWKQLLTHKQYLDAVDYYGVDEFLVKFLQK